MLQFYYVLVLELLYTGAVKIPGSGTKKFCRASWSNKASWDRNKLISKKRFLLQNKVVAVVHDTVVQAELDQEPAGWVGVALPSSQLPLTNN